MVSYFLPENVYGNGAAELIAATGADVVVPSIYPRVPGPALARRSERRGAQSREPEQRGGSGGHPPSFW